MNLANFDPFTNLGRWKLVEDKIKDSLDILFGDEIAEFAKVLNFLAINRNKFPKSWDGIVGEFLFNPLDEILADAASKAVSVSTLSKGGWAASNLSGGLLNGFSAKTKFTANIENFEFLFKP